MKLVRKTAQTALASLVLLNCFGIKAVRAQITPAIDGTGTRINQTANQFNITGGTRAGANLFHSFERFGLNSGQVANFLSNPNIQNILGRVTGGSPSLINGLIQVTGGHSNLYLMNPAGIIFGTNASLNVPAAFTATTASGIRFGNGWFNAIGTPNYAQLVGNPSDFAFTSGGTLFNAGTLKAQSVTLLGGTVINTGTIAAPGGNITIAAIPDQKVVRITPEGSLLSLDLPMQGNFKAQSLPELLTGGAISKAMGATIENGIVKISGTPVATQAGSAIVSGSVSVAGETPGKIQVLGNRVALLNGHLDASATNGGGTILVGGDYQGKGTVSNAQSTTISADSTLKADALQTGNGGKVIVWADQNTRFDGTISAKGGAQNGNGGFVETSGKQTLQVNGQVDASAPAGQSGSWLLDPSAINIVTGGTGSLTAGLFDPPTGSTIAPATIQTALDSGTNVTITTASGSGGNGDITLSNSINQTGGGAASLTLTGRRFANPGGTTISMNSTGGLTFNLNQVNPEINAPTIPVQWAVNAIGTVAGTRTINLGAGTYSGATLNLNKAVTISGAGAANTILDGQTTRQVVNVGSGANVTLNQLAINNGNATTGGGIYNSGTLTVSNSTLSGNSAQSQGGGIYNFSDTFFSMVSGTVTVSNSTLSGNSSQYIGGGIYNMGTFTVSNSTLSGNSAQRYGGGIMNQGTFTVSNSTLSGNSALYGGGISNNPPGMFTVSNSTFSGNSAQYGGGIANYYGKTTVSNSTLSGNSAQNQGGGIYNFSVGTIAVSNNIVTGNTAPTGREISGSFASSGYNLFGYGGNNGLAGGTPVASDLTPTVPLNQILSTTLGNYGGATQTLALLPGSPAINAGSATGTPAQDQRGLPRVGAPDIGAFESQGFTLTPTGTPQSTTVNTPFATPLSAQVTANNSIEPVAGGNVTVTYTAPSAGASLNVASQTAAIDASGNASITPTANSTTGTYAVTAAAPGVTGTATFNLTNLANEPSSIQPTSGSGTATFNLTNLANEPSSIQPTSGSRQSATVNSSTVNTSSANSSSLSKQTGLTSADEVGFNRDLFSKAPPPLTVNLTLAESPLRIETGGIGGTFSNPTPEIRSGQSGQHGSSIRNASGNASSAPENPVVATYDGRSAEEAAIRKVVLSELMKRSDAMRLTEKDPPPKVDKIVVVDELAIAYWHLDGRPGMSLMSKENGSWKITTSRHSDSELSVDTLVEEYRVPKPTAEKLRTGTPFAPTGSRRSIDAAIREAKIRREREAKIRRERLESQIAYELSYIQRRKDSENPIIAPIANATAGTSNEYSADEAEIRDNLIRPVMMLALKHGDSFQMVDNAIMVNVAVVDEFAIADWIRNGKREMALLSKVPGMTNSWKRILTTFGGPMNVNDLVKSHVPQPIVEKLRAGKSGNTPDYDKRIAANSAERSEVRKAVLPFVNNLRRKEGSSPPEVKNIVVMDQFAIADWYLDGRHDVALLSKENGSWKITPLSFGGEVNVYSLTSQGVPEPTAKRLLTLSGLR